MLPVPKVEVVDFSANNALANAYVVISRIPGHDLDHLESGKYPSGLSQQSRCSIAKKWAKMLLEIQATSGPMPGRIKCIDNGDGTQTFEVVPFQRKRVPGQGSKGLFDDCFVDEAGVELPGASQIAQKVPFRSTLDWFLSQFERRKNPRDPLSVIHFECLAAVATQIDAAGYMGSNQYTIYHPGLLQSPGNVMIDLGADESLTISGILSWDGAVFHPSFHGCKIPVWLWDGEYSYDKYGNLIEETPVTIEQQQIKQAFENAVGAEYLHRARAPGYGLARQLIPLAMGGRHLGFNFNPDEKVNNLLDLWGTICPLECRRSKESRRRLAITKWIAKKSSRLMVL